MILAQIVHPPQASGVSIQTRLVFEPGDVGGVHGSHSEELLEVGLDKFEPPFNRGEAPITEFSREAKRASMA
ncbi:MAG TPA: hypothetical protein VGZ29_14055 [Terriglobia bacterium]|nr:hypothetical protein [Terriglobia bacterium]